MRPKSSLEAAVEVCPSHILWIRHAYLSMLFRSGMRCLHGVLCLALLVSWFDEIPPFCMWCGIPLDHHPLFRPSIVWRSQLC